ncbi:MAG: PAS domain-containing protein [Symplocastrum torsivum CPER-KK1]|jgi:class 3 adenylate cyclase/PAS domain-containing protein|uniref:PAS domain-containing protein n=1 Tax=Symplocastrum torsivum CPER-KK1 TaxID=450513 RepID=A0A951PPN3_9CYAN|nr:PAS domain-containing protein [Symplocastrum torsivum CPER-KK1]
MTMQAQQVSTQQLILEIERLRQEVKDLKQDKTDLEILLETTTAHADAIEAQLHQSNQQLQAEIVERQRAQAVLQALASELQSLVTDITRDKADLEILLETATEHGDAVEDLLYNSAQDMACKGEKKLKKFLEAMPVGVGVLDANGKPYYGNQMAQQLLCQGRAPFVSAEELPEAFQIYVAGTNTLYPSDQLPGMRALKGENATADNLEIHRGDKVIPIESWGTPIFDDKGNVIYSIIAFQDITERKRAEAESQNFTHELFALNEAYERFVPRQFLQLLNKESIVDVQFGDQVQKEMSILFSDIRDFTMLSESMTPQENFKFINAYLSRMEPAIIENQGFIDKYIGDEIMALFSGGADSAVKAGIAMLQTLTEYNQHRAKQGYVPLQIGIGINTGSLMLGTVGGESRMDSTVIGDAVNLASRMEELTKNYGVSLLISHHTFLQLQDYNQYNFRFIDRLKVKGKSAAVSVYEIFDADPLEVREGKLATKQEFEKGLLLYNLGSFSEAVHLFKDCLRINPKDTVAQIYLKRCQKFLF